MIIETIFYYCHYGQFIYALIVLVLLLVRYKNKNSTQQLWRFNNLILGILAVPILISSLFELIISLYYGYFHEQMAFYYRAYGTWAILVIVFQILLLGLPILFLFKKFRKKHWLAVILAIINILTFPIILNKFIKIITQMNADYLHTSWSFYSMTINDFFKLTIFYVAFSMIYFIFIKNKDVKWL